LGQLGHRVYDCDRVVISDGNLLAWITTDDRRLIAKWSVFPRLFQRLAYTASLTTWLQASGIPVAAPIPARDGRLRVEVKDVSLGVYPVIDGNLLDVGDPAHVTEAGQMLATLHKALAAHLTASTAAGRPDTSSLSTMTFGPPTSPRHPNRPSSPNQDDRASRRGEM
jgi:hypothetical protein